MRSEQVAMTQADAVYREDARSYRSLAWTTLIIPVGVGLDWLVSGRHGALVHLPGWVLFGAVLVGIHWLVLHAVRTTHSLRLSPQELAVGDDVLSRDEIVGVTAGGGPQTALETLGWPNGFPRKSAAITVRLADGRDVLVPTRFPDRLQHALDVGAPAPERPVDVRVARDVDLAELASVDERAEAIFRVAGYQLPVLPFDDEALRAAPLVLVVDDPPVGFAWVDVVDGEAYLREMSVLPSAMRRGHGTGLLEAACAWAAEHGYPAMALTTFADVRWNAPFYTARGFVEVEEPSPGLRAIREHEMAVGLDRVGRRIVMRRELAAGTPVG